MTTHVYRIDLSKIDAAHPLAAAIQAKYTAHPQLAGKPVRAAFVQDAENAQHQITPHLFLIFQ